MTRRIFLSLLGGVAAAQIVKPRIGYIVDREGGLRAIEGVPGAFTVTPVLEPGLLSAAYSGKSLVVKTASLLRVDGRTFDAPEGPAVVVFDTRGKAAEVFFPAAGLLWTWRQTGFTSAAAHGIIADAYIREGELLVCGVPVRLPGRAVSVSQLGEEWLVVYSDECAYAVRATEVFELPQGEAE